MATTFWPSSWKNALFIHHYILAIILKEYFIYSGCQLHSGHHLERILYFFNRMPTIFWPSSWKNTLFIYHYILAIILKEYFIYLPGCQLHSGHHLERILYLFTRMPTTFWRSSWKNTLFIHQDANYILAILDSRKKFVAHERFQYVLLKKFGKFDNSSCL